MTTIPPVDETRLAALIQDPATPRQAWAAGAGCLTLADDLYFPEEEQAPPVCALACCAACPVALECLATALIHEAADGLRFGWWGGLSPLDRDVLWAQICDAVSPSVEIDLGDPVEAARHLRDQRLTIPAIAAKLGCSERTVHRYLAARAA
jgi:hypothetical protein